MRSSTTRFDLKLDADDKKIVARAIRSARAPLASAAVPMTLDLRLGE